MEGQEWRLGGAIVLARHGARGPTRGALKPFLARNDGDDSIPATASPVVTQWREEEIETLSPTGRQQMSSLGRWFHQRYADSLFGSRGERPTLIWRSSVSARTVESGGDFWKGFREVVLPALSEHVPKEPQPYSSEAETESRFRAYLQNSAFAAFVEELRRGPIFAAKAQQELSFLTELEVRYCGATAAAATTETPTGQAMAMAKKMSDITYYKELIECELYSIVGNEENKEMQRRALLEKLSEEDIQKIDELSHWAWNQRFFSEYQRWGPLIGGKLLQELVELWESMSSTSRPFFGLYSGHDYTIMSLLASLGFDCYPRPLLSFGSFLLFEVYRSTSRPGEDVRIKISLNAMPFADAKGRPSANVQDWSLRPLPPTPFFQRHAAHSSTLNQQKAETEQQQQQQHQTQEEEGEEQEQPWGWPLSAMQRYLVEQYRRIS
ncbi:2-phosphoxylose phosphatase 1 [Balamuthia mandrillaris]